MADTPKMSSDAVSRFFSNYLIYLTKANIPEKQQRWYVKHVEAFIKAQNRQKIRTLTAAEINSYFEEIGRQNKLKSWQFAQRIDAIRILYCELFALPVCQQINWNYWLDSAKQLEIDHPTIARQLSPEELTF